MSASTLTILSGVGIFLLITLLLVAVLLTAKHFLVHSGEVTITINKDTKVSANSGKPLLTTMADNNVFLPSACGGKGSCGQRYCPPKPSTSHARRSRTTGVWPVR